MTLSHTFSCAVSDSSLTGIMRPANWNAGHVLEAGTELYGLVPVGGVLAWAGTIAAPPAGWFICDGTSLSKTTYPGLFAAIGYIFGGSADNFLLPDLRDKFVVGAKQDDTVPKSNVRGSLEQSHAVTGLSLTHSVTIADHTNLTHSVTVDAHPDLTHVAIAVADHPSQQLTGTVAAHGTIANASAAAGSNVATVGAHSVTWPSYAAITHNVSVLLGTHVSSAVGTHALTVPAAHGAAGTLVHSFTPPAAHTPSIVPSFMAMPYVIRYQ
jgi:microcystin-dependent protein